MDKQTIEYIRLSLEQGKTSEEIYKEFLDKGFAVSDIQNAFNEISSGQGKEDGQRRIVQIIVTIGALLIGAGVFSFIAANWQEITKPVKIGVIIAAMLSAYAGGWFLKEKSGYVKTGGALILLGSIIYGGGIFLIAQMFNTRGNWPDGFILWLLGVAIMAILTDFFPLFYLAIPLAIAAIGGYPSLVIFGSFAGNPFLLTSSFLLLAAVIATFLIAIFVKKRIPAEFKGYF